VLGLVHIRDVVRATTRDQRDATAATLMTPATTLDAALSVAAAATRMRAARVQLALVAVDGQVRGLLALEDLLELMIGELYDETDREGPRARLRPRTCVSAGRP